IPARPTAFMGMSSRRRTPIVGRIIRPGVSVVHAILKRCIDCGEAHARAGSRCPGCERAFQARRNAQPKRKAYADPLYRSIPLVGQCAECGTDVDLTRHHLMAV